MTSFKIIPDTTQSSRIKVTTGGVGPQGPQGEQGIQGIQGPIGDTGVIAAISPIVYTLSTKTVSFDQTAQNTTNDSRYIKRSGDTIDAGTIV